MMDKATLREEHERGFDQRPQRIQRCREPLKQHCGVEPPRRAAHVAEWYRRHKGVITKALNGSD